MNHPFIRNEREERLFALADGLANRMKKQAAQYDRTGDFPFQHYEWLKESGYTALSVPKEYGGEALTLTELVLIQETLAQGDPATAFGVGWHLGILMDLSVRREWPEAIFRKVCEAVVQKGELINRAMTEPATGSPTRGGKPVTTARRSGDEWVLNGRKTFTTLSPIADRFIVSATIADADEVAGFLVDRRAPGLSFDKTWDTLAMRATRSDDLVLEEVHLPADAKVETFGKGSELPPAWLLHIPACYLGIALSARHDVIRFAESYQPNSLGHPIKDVPRVRDYVGEIELELIKARHTLYSVARWWDEAEDRRSEMGPELAAAKTIVLEAVHRVVARAMRIVGGQSLYKALPFERYYRDVVAGLFNPPTDDSVLTMLAARAFGD